jgi:hypothetical protein
MICFRALPAVNIGPNQTASSGRMRRSHGLAKRGMWEKEEHMRSRFLIAFLRETQFAPVCNGLGINPKTKSVGGPQGGAKGACLQADRR